MSVKTENKGVWSLKKEHENAILVTMDDGREFYANNYRVHDVENGRIVADVHYQTDMSTGNGHGRNNNIKTWEANARLIVQAPEMAELLRQFISNSDSWNKTEIQIQLFEKAKKVLNSIDK